MVKHGKTHGFPMSFCSFPYNPAEWPTLSPGQWFLPVPCRGVTADRALRAGRHHLPPGGELPLGEVLEDIDVSKIDG